MVASNAYIITEMEEKAEQKGATDNAEKVAKNFLKMGLPVEQVAKGSELSIEKVLEIKKKMMN